MEIEWARLKAAELRELARRDAVVLVPVAAMEQHGPHLPVQVDSVLCPEACRRAARLLAEDGAAVVTPVVWTGISEHHMAFGGTFTLDFTTFFGLLRCICTSLKRDGFRRIALVNGHGGNVFGLRVVVDELTRDLELPLTTVNYWHPAAEQFRGILEKQPGVQHACEGETSMMLALMPELVDMAAAEGAGVPSDVVAGGVSGAPYRWLSFPERTQSGVIGSPEAASAEKGERLLTAAAEHLAAALRAVPGW